MFTPYCPSACPKLCLKYHISPILGDGFATPEGSINLARPLSAAAIFPRKSIKFQISKKSSQGRTEIMRNMKERKRPIDAFVMLLSLLVVLILFSRTVKITYVDDEENELPDFEISLLQQLTLPQTPKTYFIQDLQSDDKRKYFVYQPSGGWGNQRIILQNAIAAANAMKRVLVLPPIAPHNFLYHGYNE